MRDAQVYNFGSGFMFSMSFYTKMQKHAFMYMHVSIIIFNPNGTMLAMSP